MPLINSADVNNAMHLAREKYESVALPEFIARKSVGRMKLHLVFLHMKKPKEGVNTFKTYRGKDRSKTNTESFDRFFLFGASGGSDVLVVFTKTAEETVTFLRYAGQGLAIRPGENISHWVFWFLLVLSCRLRSIYLRGTPSKQCVLVVNVQHSAYPNRTPDSGLICRRQITTAAGVHPEVFGLPVFCV